MIIELTTDDFVLLSGSVKIKAIFLFLICAAVFPDTLHAQPSNQQCISQSGELIFRLPKGSNMTLATRFEHGYALVTVGGGDKYGFLNIDGRLMRPSFSYAQPFSESLALVERNRQFGFINNLGRFIIPAKFRDAKNFREGLAAVSSGGKYGYIGCTGQLKIDYLYDNAADFSEGLAAVEIGRKIGFIDKTGTWIVKPKYDYVSGYSEGLSLAWQRGTKLCFIDKTGEEVLELDPQHNHSIFVRQDLSFGKLELQENISLSSFDKNAKYPHPLMSPSMFRGGLAPIAVDNKFGFINTAGDFVIPPRYDFAFPFEGERALILESGSYGFIDRNGRTAVKPVFKTAHNYSNGLAVVQEDSKKWGYINKDGHYVISPQFSSAVPFSEGMSFVESLSKHDTMREVSSNGIRQVLDPKTEFPRFIPAPDSYEGSQDIRLGKPFIVPGDKP